VVIAYGKSELREGMYSAYGHVAMSYCSEYICAMQDSVGSAVRLTWQDTAMVWQDTAIVADTLPAPLPVAPTPSLFEGHLLVAKDARLPAASIPDAMGWIFVLLLLCLVMFAIAQRRAEGRPGNVLRAAFDRGMTNQLMRHELGPNSLALWLMLFAGLLSMSLFFTSVWLRFSALDAPTFIDNAAIFGGLVGLGLGVRVLYWIAGSLFNVAPLVRIHSFDRMIIVIACGLILFPLNVLNVYGPAMVDSVTLMLGGATLVVFYLKDLQRSLSLLLNQPAVHVVHIFYYICAFKIAPLFVVIRLAMAL